MMPAFEYEALDLKGRTKRGVISADTPRAARVELRHLNLTPVSMASSRDEAANASANGGRGANRISQSQLVLITRQLAALIASSIPLEEALRAVATQIPKPGPKARLLAVRERVMEGWRFADALGEDPKSFPPIYRAVVAAGEASGDLGGVFERLATMLEKNRELKNKATASLIYPAALAIFAISVLSGLLVFVMPRIVEQFNAFNAELPLLTKVVVGFSTGLASYGLYALLAIIIISVALWRALKEPPVKLAADRWVLAIPIFGRLARAVDGARFARTLATLFSGGAPLLDSIIGAQRTISNSFIRGRLDTTVRMVGEGASIAAAIKRAGELPPMLVHMIAAGERAGALPDMLDKAAAQLEDEFDTATTVAMRLLEPAIIVLLGGSVLVIVLSTILPILRVNALASG